MKKLSSRRLFLQNSAMASTGMALFSSTLANAVIHAPSKFDGYNPFLEEQSDLRNSKFLGKHLKVQGKIFDSTGEFTLPNASVEVWHLSPNSNSFRHRGKIFTDKLGNYEFITDFPNREKGKSPRIYFKVSKNDKTYFTELLVNDREANITGTHWEENQGLKNHLMPKFKKTTNHLLVNFNISI